MNWSLDPTRLEATLAAIPGALVYGMYHFWALIGTGTATVRDYVKAAVNLVFAVLAGVVIAYFLAKEFAGWIPIPALSSGRAVGFVIGAAGWEMLPIVIETAKKWLAKFGGGAS
jgi:hypothetical protein